MKITVKSVIMVKLLLWTMGKCKYYAKYFILGLNDAKLIPFSANSVLEPVTKIKASHGED